MKPKRRILVVDDDSGMRETMADIFGELDYGVDMAKDGHEGIDLAASRSYFSILMDVNMPGLNGIDAFKEMKAANPGVKVIMMTAYASDDLIVEAKKEGAIGIFSKPLEIPKLLKFLDGMKNGRHDRPCRRCAGRK